MHIENISRKLFFIVKDLDWLTIACSEKSPSESLLINKVKKRTSIKRENDLRN